MRISLSCSVVLLAAILAFGWRNHQQLQLAENVHQQLEKEAAGLSIAPGIGSGPRVTKHLREKHQSDAKQLTSEILSYLKSSTTDEDQKDPASEKRVEDLRGRIDELDSAELKGLIAELEGDPALRGMGWETFVRLSLSKLREKSPREALALFTQMPDLYDRLNLSASEVAMDLQSLAETDPLAALEWFRKNSKDHPDQLSEDAKQAIAIGGGAVDLKLAFKVIRELEISDVSGVLSAIASRTTTEESRLSILNAMREDSATNPNKADAGKLQKAVIDALAFKTTYDGCDAAKQWLAKAALTPDEMTEYAARIANSGYYPEAGSWIGWMGETLPTGQREMDIREIVSNWTRTNYKAAGTWLATQPDSPVKRISIKSYAETVAYYEPQNAAQWAMTLPEGKDRQETLDAIYDHWPKQDPASKAAAEEFKSQYGGK